MIVAVDDALDEAVFKTVNSDVTLAELEALADSELLVEVEALKELAAVPGALTVSLRRVENDV